MVRLYDHGVNAERDSWAALRGLEGAAGPVPDDLLADVSMTLGTLRTRTAGNAALAGQLLRVAVGEGINPDYAMAGGAYRAALAARIARQPICGPLIVDGKPFTG